MGYLFHACTDIRDEHYNRSGDLPNETLRELIAGNSDLSVFSKVIEIAGYNDLLSSSQTFTIWAPDNNALSGIPVNSMTKDEARLIVENHIARFNHPASQSPLKIVRMKNNKAYYFSENGKTFGGAVIQKHDILAKNGILHTLQSSIPYFPNIYEYILTSPNTSKMAEFISQFEENIIDPLSIQADGTIRDTVYIRYNPLFDYQGTWYWFGSYISGGLGQINKEDSVYTALIPDNTAWDAAYARISPYFRTVRNDESVQRFQTSLAIIEDLFFRNKIDDPAGKDTLVTTSPSIIRQPSTLFDSTQKIQASNGLIFLTGSNVNYVAQETFMKPIYVEADEPEGRRIANNNTTVVPRILDGASGDMATNSRFLEVFQTTLDDNMENQPRIIFDIPQTLSGRYNIYAEFLPGELVRQGEPRATRFRCTLNYQNANGNIASSIVNNVETKATEKVKVLLFSGFNFPVANYYDRSWRIDYLKGLHTIDERLVPVKLEIAVRVTAAEYNSRQFGRSYCIDRIILEPVN
jgi:hypothetical protein